MLVSSPRTWGCFQLKIYSKAEVSVFPTHVGVFPSDTGVQTVSLRLPHARGGVSRRIAFGYSCCVSSPRTWGCFRPLLQLYASADVFPTHVGVFPDLRSACATTVGLPHARGGVSGIYRVDVLDVKSSPRTWGCFAWTTRVSNPVCVFATHVGVFPPLLSTRWHSFCLHHVRGVFLVRGLPALAYWSLPYTCGT